MFQQNEYDYVIWQNRAFWFYEASRLLHRNEMYPQAAYYATMSIELLLKATLKYWVKDFVPKDKRHEIENLSDMVKGQVPEAESLLVPRYFFEGKKYLLLTRYPEDSKGIGIPSSFINDLDRTFFFLIKLTPFQHNTELVNTLENSRSKRCRNISLKNLQLKDARSFLKIVPRKSNSPKKQKPISIEEFAALLSTDKLTNDLD